MNNSLVSSVLKLVKDGQEHELYELNKNYRFTYTQAKDSVEFLSKMGVIHSVDHQFKLKTNLKKTEISNLYKCIRYRTISLEDNVIEEYRNKALIINSLYKPKLSMLDSALVIDEK